MARHGRLVYFIRHLAETTDQLAACEARIGEAEADPGKAPGQDWGAVLDNLVGIKGHILNSLMPIKMRLESQLYGPSAPMAGGP